MITYGFIKRLNEDKTINVINKIIFGTFGIIIGIIMDFITILSFPLIITAGQWRMWWNVRVRYALMS